MLPLRARVDLGVMAIKEFSTFPKASKLLKPQHHIVYWHIRTLVGEVLPLCRDALAIFCSLGWLGQFFMMATFNLCSIKTTFNFITYFIAIVTRIDWVRRLRNKYTQVPRFLHHNHATILISITYSYKVLLKENISNSKNGIITVC